MDEKPRIFTNHLQINLQVDWIIVPSLYKLQREKVAIKKKLILITCAMIAPLKFMSMLCMAIGFQLSKDSKDV